MFCSLDKDPHYFHKAILEVCAGLVASGPTVTCHATIGPTFSTPGDTTGGVTEDQQAAVKQVGRPVVWSVVPMVALVLPYTWTTDSPNTF